MAAGYISSIVNVVHGLALYSLKSPIDATLRQVSVHVRVTLIELLVCSYVLLLRLTGLTQTIIVLC